jgi:hypothetical protein
MPVKPCTKNGKKGFKWGDQGTCYTYNSNDSKEQARKKALAQGRAIKANQ